MKNKLTSLYLPIGLAIVSGLTFAYAKSGSPQSKQPAVPAVSAPMSCCSAPTSKISALTSTSKTFSAVSGTTVTR